MVVDGTFVSSSVASVMMNGLCCAWRMQEHEEQRKGFRKDVREEYESHQRRQEQIRRRIVESEIWQKRYQFRDRYDCNQVEQKSSSSSMSSTLEFTESVDERRRKLGMTKLEVALASAISNTNNVDDNDYSDDDDLGHYTVLSDHHHHQQQQQQQPILSQYTKQSNNQCAACSLGASSYFEPKIFDTSSNVIPTKFEQGFSLLDLEEMLLDAHSTTACSSFGTDVSPTPAEPQDYENTNRSRRSSHQEKARSNAKISKNARRRRKFRRIICEVKRAAAVDDFDYISSRFPADVCTTSMGVQKPIRICPNDNIDFDENDSGVTTSSSPKSMVTIAL